MAHPDRIHFELKYFGLSKTAPRALVYFALAGHVPCTRQSIVKATAGKVHQATVYRTIQALLNTRVLMELPAGLVDFAPPHRQRHYFWLCYGCGMRHGFWNKQLEQAIDRVTSKSRFVLIEQQLQISGLCPRCAQQI